VQVGPKRAGVEWRGEGVSGVHLPMRLGSGEREGLWILKFQCLALSTITILLHLLIWWNQLGRVVDKIYRIIMFSVYSFEGVSVLSSTNMPWEVVPRLGSGYTEDTLSELQARSWYRPTCCCCCCCCSSSSKSGFQIVNQQGVFSRKNKSQRNSSAFLLFFVL